MNKNIRRSSITRAEFEEFVLLCMIPLLEYEPRDGPELMLQFANPHDARKFHFLLGKVAKLRLQHNMLTTARNAKR